MGTVKKAFGICSFFGPGLIETDNTADRGVAGSTSISAAILPVKDFQPGVT
jgi:hypothetical protein